MVNLYNGQANDTALKKIITLLGVALNPINGEHKNLLKSISICDTILQVRWKTIFEVLSTIIIEIC